MFYKCLQNTNHKVFFFKLQHFIHLVFTYVVLTTIHLNVLVFILIGMLYFNLKHTVNVTLQKV